MAGQASRPLQRSGLGLLSQAALAHWQKLEELPIHGKQHSAGCVRPAPARPAAERAADGAGRHFRAECWSAPCYRLFALTDAAKKVSKPGMVRVADGGVRVFLEVWDVPSEAFGRFIVQVPAPLGIGTVQLEGGSSTLGFICEGIVAQGGPGIEDISSLGSWLEYVRLRKESC